MTRGSERRAALSVRCRLVRSRLLAHSRHSLSLRISASTFVSGSFSTSLLYIYLFIMPDALSVSSFPEPHPAYRQTTTLDQENTSYTGHAPKKHGQRPRIPCALHIASVQANSTPTQLDGNSPNSPYSPIIFRSSRPGSSWDHVNDRSSTLPSSFHRANLWQYGRGPAYSTKDDFSTLPLSHSSPDPSYNPLTTTARAKGKGTQADLLLSVPARSTSLPLQYPYPVHASAMSRAPSPSPSLAESEQSSADIVFAPMSPPEPDIVSKPSPPTKTFLPSSIVIRRTAGSASGSDYSTSCSDLSSKGTSRSASPTAVRAELPRTNIRVPQTDLFELYPSSLGSVGYGGLLYAAPCPPIPYKPKKPKLKVPDNPPPQASQSPSSKSPKVSFRRMRMLMGRRSISSIDAVVESSQTASGGPAASTATLVADDHSQLSAESDATVEVPDPHPTSAADDPHRDGRIVTHRAFGDIWEEQDIDAVIPMLRSMRVKA